ncbi:MAG: cyclomaltodextrinase N-terminal domain-containing protein, partial [Pseudomonadota bacterium]
MLHRIARRTIALVFAMTATVAMADPIARIDPPNWWTGYRDTTLQLMVSGPGIAHYRVSVADDRARVMRTVTLDSPNYLFVYLD